MNNCDLTQRGINEDTLNRVRQEMQNCGISLRAKDFRNFIDWIECEFSKLWLWRCQCDIKDLFINNAQSKTFTRDDCPSGSIGSTITYVVPAGKYVSSISQEDADNQAMADINANGQTFANANGLCIIDSFNITYNSNGGSPTPVDINNPHNAGSTIIIIIENMSKIGYTFAGWTSSAFPGIKQGGDTFTMPAQDTVLTAQWTLNTHTLSYSLNGGFASIDGTPAGQVNYDAIVNVVSSGEVNTGYIFSGWKRSDTNEILTSPSTFNMPDNDVTLIAQWTELYSVKYDANGGTSAPVDPNSPYQYGATVTVQNYS